MSIDAPKNKMDKYKTVFFMEIAQRLARKGLGRTGDNPSVGAVIVCPEHGHIIGAGRTADGGRPHGEPIALKQAGKGAKGATLYVTLEPCAHFGNTPPCVNAIIEAGIQEVFIGALDPDPRTAGLGMKQLQDAGLKVCLLENEGAIQLAQLSHILKIKQNRPFITMKMAISKDGFCAGVKGEPIKISGARTNRLTHLLRASHNGILVSARTFENDHPLLNVRLEGMEKKKLPAFILSSSKGEEANVRTLHNTSPEFLKADIKNKTERENLFSYFIEKGVTRLLIEAGAEFFDVLVRNQIPDRIILYHSQSTQLTEGIPAFSAPSQISFSHMPSYQLTRKMDFGADDIYIFWHQNYADLLKSATLPYEEF